MNRSKWAAVALPLAAVLSLLATDPGGKPEIPAGSYRGGYYSPGGASMVAAKSVDVDTVSVLLTYAEVTHDEAEYNTFAASADTTILLGDIGFRYAYFYWSTPEDTGVSTNVFSFTPGYPSWADIDSTTGVGTRQLMFHLDYTALGIPESATILRCVMKYPLIISAAVNRADSVGIVLMDNPGDSAWLSAPLHGTYELAAQTSWNHANAVDDSSWAIWMTDRGYPHQWGSDETWWGLPYNDAGYSGVIEFDLTEFCQKVLRGGANYGHKMIGKETAYAIYQSASWGSDAYPNAFPWFEIEYSTDRYRSRFPNNAEWAFVFSTDDNITVTNDTLTAIWSERGYKYTIFTKGSDGENGSFYGGYDRAGHDDLMRWYDMGFPIGYHTYRHIRVDLGTSPSGLASYDGRGLNIVAWTAGAHPESVMADPACTGYDSLLADCDPTWFTAQVEASQGRTDLSSSPRWMNSFALAYHHYTQQALVALNHVGYKYIRGESGTTISAPTTLPSGRYGWPGFARWVPAGTEADSVWSGFYLEEPTRPINQWMTGVNQNVYSIIGDPEGAGYETSYEAVLENLRLVVENFQARGRDALVMYDHYKIDGTRARWLLNAVEELGGAPISVDEYIARITARSEPCDTPASYGQNDTLSFVAEDRTWFRPRAR